MCCFVYFRVDLFSFHAAISAQIRAVSTVFFLSFLIPIGDVFC
ncbi:hypothetical protein PORCRE_172 [Porphyromonas crevioricanis JCM 15906]|uniref:Uncharacterized protein n=1 Tax=Porphyromonas crevioricanis JCM 15906 TaxID=1305617 RepID=S4NFX0_9PORP|nr:hypothetical protein PORCRE_172 [Porphyromonas crevioricanis JCM 15906]GAD07882.1 hypothetical protein PORCAN_1510 [Porphyromonas crevioricanis JCM 13913]